MRAHIGKKHTRNTPTLYSKRQWAKCMTVATVMLLLQWKNLLETHFQLTRFIFYWNCDWRAKASICEHTHIYIIMCLKCLHFVDVAIWWNIYESPFHNNTVPLTIFIRISNVFFPSWFCATFLHTHDAVFVICLFFVRDRLMFLCVIGYIPWMGSTLEIHYLWIKLIRNN